jgi:hypothetical protein
MTDRDRTAPRSTAAPTKSHEGVPIADPIDQADSRLRPRRRRPETIARPARVDMR